ncbi:MAG: SDR family oxidoreductase [Actinomycetota bacterium]
MDEWSELLAGKTAVIAGLGGGIGGATARALATAGADVAGIDIVDDFARPILSEIESMGRRTHLELADLTDEDAVRTAIENIYQHLGRIDILVPVMGGTLARQAFRPFLQWDQAAWDDIIDFNLTYVAKLTRAALPRILEDGGGALVFVSSISGVLSAENHAAYGAAKMGLINLTRSLALEYGPSVRVNIVAPGPIFTPTSGAFVAGLSKDFSFLPLKRSGQPHEIAQAILFLASPLSSYVTGQTLCVDGGSTIVSPFGTLT